MPIDHKLRWRECRCRKTIESRYVCRHVAASMRASVRMEEGERVAKAAWRLASESEVQISAQVTLTKRVYALSHLSAFPTLKTPTQEQHRRASPEISRAPRKSTWGPHNVRSKLIKACRIHCFCVITLLGAHTYVYMVTTFWFS